MRNFDRKFITLTGNSSCGKKLLSLTIILNENLYFIKIMIENCLIITECIIIHQYFLWLFNPSLEDSSNLPGKYPTLLSRGLNVNIQGCSCLSPGLTGSEKYQVSFILILFESVAD